MTQDERTTQGAAARLDAQLRDLPPELEPRRDLWPQIAARLEQRAAPVAAAARGRPAWLWQAAAAVVLVAASSLLTARLLDRPAPAGQSADLGAAAGAPRAEDGVTTMPAAFGPTGQLDPEYLAARRLLTLKLEQRIAALPPSARARLEFNLGEMRRAADEINAALAEQPGDPLLEELLLKTYQDELAVLANVNQLTAGLEAVKAAPIEKRMQL